MVLNKTPKDLPPVILNDAVEASSPRCSKFLAICTQENKRGSRGSDFEQARSSTSNVEKARHAIQSK